MTCGKWIWSSKWEVPTEKYVDELFEFDAERMSQVEQHCWINPKPIWNGMGWILMCHWDGWMDWWAPRPCGWPLHKCGQATGPWLGWLEIIIAIIAEWRWMIWPGKYRKECPVIWCYLIVSGRVSRFCSNNAGIGNSAIWCFLIFSHYKHHPG